MPVLQPMVHVHLCPCLRGTTETASRSARTPPNCPTSSSFSDAEVGRIMTVPTALLRSASRARPRHCATPLRPSEAALLWTAFLRGRVRGLTRVVGHGGSLTA
jgi:hypothetical protein